MITDQSANVNSRRSRCGGIGHCTGHAAIRDGGRAGDLADQTGGAVTGRGNVGSNISGNFNVFNHSAGAGLAEQSGVAAGDVQLEGDGMPVAVKGAFEG